MKVWLLLLTVVFSQSTLAENPQRRVCRLNAGSFMALDTENDNVGFCFFNSQSKLGTISLMELVYERRQTLALKAFKATRSNQGFLSCENAGANEIFAISSEEVEHSVCEFSDDSFIGKETLLNGWSHESNNQIIKLF